MQKGSRICSSLLCGTVFVKDNAKNSKRQFPKLIERCNLVHILDFLNLNFKICLIFKLGRLHHMNNKNASRSSTFIILEVYRSFPR